MGGHEHGAHDVSEYSKVPDYRIYKVENAPQLVTLRRILAAQGLKDPWIRNEVWRYDVNHFGTEKSRIYTLVFRGFRVGFAAFLVTIAGTAIYDRIYPAPDHHDRSYGHNDGKHH